MRNSEGTEVIPEGGTHGIRAGLLGAQQRLWALQETYLWEDSTRAGLGQLQAKAFIESKRLPSHRQI